MRTRKKVLSTAFLLGTTFLVHPALAADNSVGSQSLTATNNGDVKAKANLDQSQSITSGVGNFIGANATGALGTASVAQTIFSSTVQTGSTNAPGNEVVVTGFVAGFNFGDVRARATITGTAGIDNGQANSIGAIAVGASGNASISQTLSNGVNLDITSLDPNHVQITQGVGAFNFDSVRARLSAGASTVSDGVGNSISAQAVGSQASASISSRAFDTTTSATAVGPAQSNLVEVGTGPIPGDLSLLSFNLGNVSARANLSGDLRVLNGIGNSIGASAVGAAAGAGVNQTVSNSTVGNSIDLTTLFANTVNVDGAIVSLNGGNVRASLNLNPNTPAESARISTGIGNSISAQAVGASAGASIATQFDNVTSTAGVIHGNNDKSQNTVKTGVLFAGNGGNVTATANLLEGVVSDGIGNFIGASAVGASAGAGITQAISTSTISQGTALGRNRVTVDAIAAQNGSGPGSLLSDTVQATVNFNGGNAVANEGIGNTVGASAVGASAGANIGQQLLGDSAKLENLSNNTVNVKASAPATDAISAINAGHSAVSATVNMSPGQTLAEANSGIGNSVSATAGGASASASISSLMEGSATLAANGNAQANTVDTTGGAVTSIFASNNGTVTALFNAAPAGAVSAEADVGIANSVGATAFGASASASINQSVSHTIGSGADLTTLFNNSVTTGDITARNHPAGAVTATLDVSGNTVVGSTPNISPIGDSVSAQAVGASATASISSNFFRVGTVTGTLPTTDKNTVSTGDLRARNHANIVATASLGADDTRSSTIFNGVNGFIGASASGASAGAGISQLVDGSSPNLLNLPGNTITAGSVSARNTGKVTATLDNPGSATIVTSLASPATAANTIGNTIGAQASGASASASVASIFNDVAAQTDLGAGTPSLNSVTVTSLNSNNSGRVSAKATFGTASTTTLASIGGGIGNTIGASAVGASSAASINQVVNDGVWSGGPINPGSRLATLPSNSVSTGSITSTNSAPVTARMTTLGTTTSTITGGVGNTIGATAIGASAGASISQIISNVH
jgi:hypothetical protein